MKSIDIIGSLAATLMGLTLAYDHFTSKIISKHKISEYVQSVPLLRVNDVPSHATFSDYFTMENLSLAGILERNDFDYEDQNVLESNFNARMKEETRLNGCSNDGELLEGSCTYVPDLNMNGRVDYQKTL